MELKYKDLLDLIEKLKKLNPEKAEELFKRVCKIDNHRIVVNIPDKLFLLGEPIYQGDKCWIVYKCLTGCHKDYGVFTGIHQGEKDTKYFSNGRNAKTYYNKLKWEGKLKFKVGNKIKSKNYTLIKKIKNIDWLNEQYIVPLETSITDGAIKFIKQNNWQLYKEPKFITVEGFKKYMGDELGYFVDNGLGFNYSAEKINKYTEIIDSYKYNIYVGKVDVIGQEDYPFSVKCNGRILRSSFILTLKELALKEGIEVGMKIDTDLVESWYKKKYPKFQKNQKLEREVYKISALGIESKIPIFKVTHPIAEIRDINIIGFKDFKEKWEAESSAERKANKLGFKIGDKVWGNKPLRHGNFKHKYYGEIDGVEDTNGDLTPCRKGDLFCPQIKLETGEIVNWTKGKKAKIHFKVCDKGTYILKDAENNIIHMQESYVPNMLCPADNGYGDCIIISVDENGIIENFKVDFDDMLERDFNNQN